MNIDINLIKEKKEVYGDNFAPICERWNSYLGVKITPVDVAMLLALAEETIILHVKGQLNETKESVDFSINRNLQFKYEILKNKLALNMTNKANYLFIATNFEEYKRL